MDKIVKWLYVFIMCTLIQTCFGQGKEQVGILIGEGICDCIQDQGFSEFEPSDEFKSVYLSCSDSISNKFEKEIKAVISGKDYHAGVIAGKEFFEQMIFPVLLRDCAVFRNVGK